MERRSRGHAPRGGGRRPYDARGHNPNVYVMEQNASNGFQTRVCNPNYEHQGRRDMPPSYAESVISEDPYLKPTQFEDPYLKPVDRSGSYHGYQGLPVSAVTLDDLSSVKKPGPKSTAEETVYDELYADINDNDLGTDRGIPITTPVRTQKTQTNKRCYIIIAVVIVLVLVVGGVIGAFLSLRGNNLNGSPTAAPNVAESTTVFISSVEPATPGATPVSVSSIELTTPGPCDSNTCTERTDCCECACPSNIKTGFVLAENTTMPLYGVSIQLRCGVEIGRTGVDGTFVLYGVCDDSLLTFSKPHYVNTELTYEDLGGNVVLQNKVFLEMVEQPMHEAATIGGDVTISCRAEGHPQPEQYQWYKDGNMIPGGVDGTLVLSDVAQSQQGYYRCAARTSQTTLFSDSALLTVPGAGQNGCENSLIQNKINLPGDCTHQGSETINLGRCRTGACISGSDEGDCCGPSRLSTQTIQCGTENYNIQTVTECGCSICGQSMVNIIGIVGDVNSNQMMTYGEVLFYPQTDTGTGRDAIFQLSAHVANSRNKLFFQNLNMASLDFYESTTYIFHSPHIVGTSYETTLDVRLNDRSQSDVSHGQNLNIVNLRFSITDAELGAISIPRNSVVDSSGRIVEQYEMYFTVIQPDYYPQIRAVPADFTVLDDQGYDAFLFTYGIFTLEMRNEDVADTPIARVQGDISLTIPTSARERLGLIDMSSVFLWKLNTVSGYWEQIDSFVEISTSRRKRNTGLSPVMASIPGLSTTDNPAWLSIGKLNSEQCHSKVRVFKNEALVKENQLQGAEIVYHVTDVDGSATISRIRAHSDDGDFNGYCIKHPCGAQTHKLKMYAYIYDGIITGHGITHSVLASSLDVTVGNEGQLMSGVGAVSDTSHPFYHSDTHSTYTSQTCSLADYSEDHFILKADKHLYTIDAIHPPRHIAQNCDPNLYRLWSGVDQHIGRNAYKACYIKIHIAGDTRQTRIRVISKVGTFQNGSTINPADLYGIREDRIEENFACIEFRPYGQVGCNSNPTSEYDTPHIDISIVDPQTSYAITLDDSFAYHYPDHNIMPGQSRLSVEMRDGAVGRANGLYCAVHSNLYFARREARDKCLKYNTDPDPGYAVLFTES